jgi:nucleotide-binding universal stress UspA family protein
MQKVLLPFDGSESAKRAVRYLVDAARSYPDLEVHVLNVQPAIRLHGEYFSQAMLERMNEVELKHSADVNAQALQVLSAAGVRCGGHESIGEVIAEVGKAVATFGCDTIVMGTRGMSNFSNLMLGSVATRVVHEVSVPVMLVK